MWLGCYKSTVALCHRCCLAPPPTAATVSATTVQSRLAQSPATHIDIVRRCRRHCSAAVSFSTIFSVWNKLQKIFRPMYNRHPWLSQQFYGEKSAYYIRSFTVYMGKHRAMTNVLPEPLNVSMRHRLQQVIPAWRPAYPWILLHKTSQRHKPVNRLQIS